MINYEVKRRKYFNQTSTSARRFTPKFAICRTTFVNRLTANYRTCGYIQKFLQTAKGKMFGS
jgi:hypothetical protein